MIDVFVAGSWRNRQAVAAVVDALDDAGLRSYCFTSAEYTGAAAVVATPGGADDADLDAAGVRDVFERDLAALHAADQFVIVLPAGAAAHMEAGIAHGLGKRCWAVGTAERSETLYRVFDAMCSDPADLVHHLTARRRPS